MTRFHADDFTEIRRDELARLMQERDLWRDTRCTCNEARERTLVAEREREEMFQQYERLLGRISPVCEAAELAGERTATLLELLRPWASHGDQVQSVAAELTLALARLGTALDQARIAT